MQQPLNRRARQTPPLLCKYRKRTNEQAAAGGAKEPLTFVHAAAEDTRLPPESADLASMCLVAHELPQAATRAILREAFRWALLPWCQLCCSYCRLLPPPPTAFVPRCLRRCVRAARRRAPRPAPTNQNDAAPIINSNQNSILKPGGVMAIMEMNPNSAVFRRIYGSPFAFAAFKSTEPHLEGEGGDGGEGEGEREGGGLLGGAAAGLEGRGCVAEGLTTV